MHVSHAIDTLTAWLGHEENLQIRTFSMDIRLKTEHNRKF